MSDANLQTTPSTLPELYALRARLLPEEAAYWTRTEEGAWKPTAWAEFWHSAERLARALKQLGVEPGMRVGLMLPTSLDWERVQLAALLCGAVVVGLDGHDEPARRSRMVALAALDVLVVKRSADLETLGREPFARVKLILTLEGVALTEHGGKLDVGVGPAPIFSLSNLFTRSADLPLPPPAAGALATIIFTSGSTGEPRAIGYTHAQVLSAVNAILAAYPEIRRGDRLVCWLPLSNLFQRVLNFCAAGCGANTWFVEDPRRIAELLPEIRPQVFIGVPRFFEKLQAGISQSLGQRPPWIRWAAAWALARPIIPGKVQADGPFARLAERFVYRQIRAVLGGEIRFLVSGCAPFPGWLSRWFERCGLPVLEAYGLSENAVPVALNTPAHRRSGSVGRVLFPNEVRLAADGEVLVRGPGCATRYLGESASLLDAEGWLSTGDLGRFTEDGFLELIGRRSEVFKLSTGRKVAPSRVEAALAQSDLIDQAIVVGAAQKCTIAIVSLSPQAIELSNEALRARLIAEYPRLMREIEEWLAPAALLIRRAPFTIAAGELTANLKLRRQFIAERYQEALDAIYSELGGVGLARLPGDDWFALILRGTMRDSA